MRWLLLHLLLAVATPALAQQACGPREAVLQALAEKYGETRQSIGLAPNDIVVEVFASTETGTRTIILTKPSAPRPRSSTPDARS